MQTFPSGVTTTPIATYRDEASGITLIISKRTGGISADDYLVAGTNSFSATCRTRERAIETARRELARLTREVKQ